MVQSAYNLLEKLNHIRYPQVTSDSMVNVVMSGSVKVPLTANNHFYQTFKSQVRSCYIRTVILQLPGITNLIVPVNENLHHLIFTNKPSILMESPNVFVASLVSFNLQFTSSYTLSNTDHFQSTSRRLCQMLYM